MSGKSKNRIIQIFSLLLLFIFLGVVIFRKFFSSNYKTFSTNKNIDYNDLFDNVWVINLDRDIDRWNTTNNRLKQINITPKRWKAIDAKMENVKCMYENHQKSNLLNKLVYKTPKNKFNFFRNFFEVTQSELACLLSHITLWEHLYENKVPYAIIFEDDIIFSDTLIKQEIVDTIEKYKNADIIFLGYCFSWYYDMFPLKKDKPGKALCGHAYVITYQALHKLLTKHIKINKLDKLTYQFCDKNQCILTKNKKVSGGSYGAGLFHQDRKQFGSHLR